MFRAESWSFKVLLYLLIIVQSGHRRCGRTKQRDSTLSRPQYNRNAMDIGTHNFEICLINEAMIQGKYVAIIFLTVSTFLIAGEFQQFPGYRKSGSNINSQTTCQPCCQFRHPGKDIFSQNTANAALLRKQLLFLHIGIYKVERQ